MVNRLIMSKANNTLCEKLLTLGLTTGDLPVLIVKQHTLSNNTVFL